MLIDHARLHVVGVHDTGHVNALVRGRHPRREVTGIVARVTWDGYAYQITGVDGMGTGDRTAETDTLAEAMTTIEEWCQR